MLNKEQKEFLGRVFPGIDLEGSLKCDDAGRRIFMYEQAERLLVGDGPTMQAEYFTYNMLDEDGNPTGRAPWFGGNETDDFLINTARLLMGLLSSDKLNMFLEVAGLPLFTTNADEVYDTGGKQLRQQIADLGYPHIMAHAMKRICERATDWAINHNAVIMDNLSGGTYYLEMEINKTEGSKKYVTQCMKVLDETEEHLRQGREHGLNIHSQCIIDSIWGFAPHPYDEDSVKCAKEIFKDAEAMTVTKETDKNDFVEKIIQSAKTHADANGIDFDLGLEGFSISLTYMQTWAGIYYDVRNGEKTINNDWDARI